jgi:hypothetical protein
VGASKIRSPDWSETTPANCVRDFGGMAQPLRTVKLQPSAWAQLVSAKVLISEFSDRYLWY